MLQILSLCWLCVFWIEWHMNDINVYWCICCIGTPEKALLQYIKDLKQMNNKQVIEPL